ncbi:MAG: hypothetical protein AAGK32_19050, partial [Actinomycetota bacterium]
MADRRAADPRERREEAEDLRKEAAKPAETIDPTDLTPPPTEPDQLGDQAEADELPQTEAPEGEGLD